MPHAPRKTPTLDLEEALAEPGCVVCTLTLNSVDRFIASLAFEQVNDVSLRAELRADRGFCNAHAYRWLREARSVLGTAIIYQDVLKNTLKALESEPAGPRRSGLLGGLGATRNRSSSAGPRRCVLCRVQRDAERRSIRALLDDLRLPDIQTAFTRSDGLCLPHATAAIRQGGPSANLVRHRTQEAVNALLADLAEVIRKEDYRFRDEPRSPAEVSAPRRAIAASAGAEGVVSTGPEGPPTD